MTPAEQLTAWRTEIEQELGQLEGERDQVRAELADAERQVASLRAAHASLVETCERGVGLASEGLATPLWGRLTDADGELRQQIGRLRGSLPARLKALESVIEGRRLALLQIARALEPEQPRHVPEVVKRPAPAPPYRFLLARG